MNLDNSIFAPLSVPTNDIIKLISVNSFLGRGYGGLVVSCAHLLLRCYEFESHSLLERLFPFKINLISVIMKDSVRSVRLLYESESILRCGQSLPFLFDNEH